jgi:hypothetical protein
MESEVGAVDKQGPLDVGHYSLLVTYRFDLVGEGILEFSEHDWRLARYLLSEFQPATNVSLIGNPPSRIRVKALGDRAEVAPALLTRIEDLAGQPLRVEVID